MSTKSKIVKVLPPGYHPLAFAIERAGIGRSRYEFLRRRDRTPPVVFYKEPTASGRLRAYMHEDDIARWILTRNRRPGARPFNAPSLKWEGK